MSPTFDESSERPDDGDNTGVTDDAAGAGDVLGTGNAGRDAGSRDMSSWDVDDGDIVDAELVEAGAPGATSPAGGSPKDADTGADTGDDDGSLG